MSETNLIHTRSYPSPNSNAYKASNSKNPHYANNTAIQKHRLILDSLNVVPYEEYYEKNHPQQDLQSRIPQSP